MTFNNNIATRTTSLIDRIYEIHDKIQVTKKEKSIAADERAILMTTLQRQLNIATINLIFTSCSEDYHIEYYNCFLLTNSTHIHS